MKLSVAAMVLIACGAACSERSAPPPSTESRPFPPVPRWRPDVKVDIERTAETFAYYTNRRQAFAVFENGTVVALPEGSREAETDAKAILDKVYNYHPDFNPQLMDDGNFLVSYSQPAYSVVFADEVAAHRAYIEEHHLEGLTRDEVVLNAAREPNKFDEVGKVGLFGRARMFLDAQHPVVVRVWRPPASRAEDPR